MTAEAYHWAFAAIARKTSVKPGLDTVIEQL